MTRTALITGITGQDGSYLAEFLIAKGYQVHGMVRRVSSFNTGRIEHLYDGVHVNPQLALHYGDLSDAGAIRTIVDGVAPDEVYNLAAQSHVRISFDQPQYTADVTGVGTLRMLDAVHEHSRRTGKRVRFYQAGSSEMFGSAKPPQDELTRFEPRSPYACAKVYAHYQVVNHRESYGMFACNGILFNHESPRRGENFVTRKITRAATRIKVGLQEQLVLGNLDARRDWGFAGDYVQAMWLMLQQEQPSDYVVCTGASITVRDFLERAFARVGLDWKRHVTFDDRFRRPAEVDHLEGDCAKARRLLGWKPETSIDALIAMMVDADLALAEREGRSR
jgi:GDPmannose 4,6-dehydratase